MLIANGRQSSREIKKIIRRESRFEGLESEWQDWSIIKSSQAMLLS
jgi:hypothetical protein